MTAPDTRAAIADGLTLLVDHLAADDKLPVGRWADTQGLRISVHVETATEVAHAADRMDSVIDLHRNPDTGSMHTVTEGRFGAVTFSVVHIEPAAVTV